MKFKFILTIFLLVTTTLCVEEEEGVIVLEDKNLETEVQNYEYLLVEFYAPWCEHCQSLAPEYSKAAEILRGEQFKNKPVYLAKIDATINNKSAEKFEVESFPTLKFFKNGEFIRDYDGGRTTEEIVHWVKKRIAPPSKELKTKEEVENFKQEGDVVVVYFGDEKSAGFKVFNKTAQKFDDVLFAHVTENDQELLNYFDIKQNQLLLFKNFDEGKNKYTAQIEEDSLTHFVNFYSIPLVSKFDERSAEAIFGMNKAGLFLIRSEKNAEQKKLDEIIKNLASEYREKILFVISDVSGEFEEKLAEYLGLTEANLPQLRIIDVKGEEDVRNYVLTDPITQENVQNFIVDFLNDKLTVHVRSEEVPQEQTEAVFKIVGKTFSEVVYDPHKNVLVEFYAPWCSHCQKLAPIYEKLAEHFKNNPKVMIAEIDHSNNEVGDIKIEGYPSIKMFLAGDASVKSNPVDYNGDRELSDLIKFVDNLITQEDTVNLDNSTNTETQNSLGEDNEAKSEL